MQPRILLVEGDPAHAALVRRRLLAAGYALECVDNYPDAAEFMAYGSADAAILSSIAGDALPAELCAQVRHTHGDRVLLLVTGPADRGERILSYRAGADDYVCKPAEADTLALRLERLLKDAAHRRDVLRLGGAIGAHYLLVGDLAREGVLGALQVGSLLSDVFRVVVDGGFHEQGNIWVKDYVVVGAQCGALNGEDALTRLYNLREGCFRIVEERFFGTPMQLAVPAPAPKFDAVA